MYQYLVLVTAEHVKDGVEDLHVQLLQGQQLLLAPVPIHRCLSIAPPLPISASSDTEESEGWQMKQC
jgi:hypothetical protein